MLGTQNTAECGNWLYDHVANGSYTHPLVRCSFLTSWGLVHCHSKLSGVNVFNTQDLGLTWQVKYTIKPFTRAVSFSPFRHPHSTHKGTNKDLGNIAQCHISRKWQNYDPDSVTSSSCSQTPTFCHFPTSPLYFSHLVIFPNFFSHEPLLHTHFSSSARVFPIGVTPAWSRLCVSITEPCAVVHSTQLGSSTCHRTLC